jgi:hypothetical protein
VIGLSARQPAIVPGNNQVFGFIQRQYTRNVSSKVGLSGTYEAGEAAESRRETGP